MSDLLRSKVLEAVTPLIFTRWLERQHGERPIDRWLARFLRDAGELAVTMVSGASTDAAPFLLCEFKGRHALGRPTVPAPDWLQFYCIAIMVANPTYSAPEMMDFVGLCVWSLTAGEEAS